MSRDGRQGFTLIELLVALLLLGMGALAVIPLFAQAMRGTASNGDLGEVGAFAVERMERLRATEYDELDPGGDLFDDAAGYFESPAEDVRVRWEILDNSAFLAGTKIVSVRALSTGERMGIRREVMLGGLRGD